MNRQTFPSGDASDRPDIEPCDPHFDLLKPRFQRLLELDEEVLRVRRARRIDENPHHFIAKNDAAIFPLAANHLRLVRHGSKGSAEFPQGQNEKTFRNLGAVIEPPGQQDLESA